MTRDSLDPHVALSSGGEIQKFFFRVLASVAHVREHLKPAAHDLACLYGVGQRIKTLLIITNKLFYLVFLRKYITSKVVPFNVFLA